MLIRCSVSRLAGSLCSLGEDRTPFYRYVEERWPCAFLACTSLLGGALLLSCCIMSYIIPHSGFSYTAVKALEGQILVLFCLPSHLVWGLPLDCAVFAGIKVYSCHVFTQLHV